MKHHLVVSAMYAIAVPLAMAQTSTWTADPAHSAVNFSVRRLEFTVVRGQFGHVTGELNLDEADVTKSVVQMTIDITGIKTQDDDRDGRMRSDAFFDVQKYPVATFVSSSVSKSGRGLTVVGNLNLHGVTKPLTLQVNAPIGTKNGTDMKPHMRYMATTTINRSAFSVGDAYPEVAIGDTVNLNIQLEVVKR